MVFSLASALVTGMPMLTKLVVAMVPAWRLTGSTQGEILHWVAHRALPVLARGEYNGVSIAGGWRFFWAGNKADWKAKVELNKEWRYYSCANICQLCFASTGDFCNYTDMSENAEHWAHKISFKDYLLQCQTIGREPTPALQAPCTGIGGWLRGGGAAGADAQRLAVDRRAEHHVRLDDEHKLLRWRLGVVQQPLRNS